MAASLDDIRGWLETGIQRGDTHVILACDTFEWEDYPVYVKPGQEVNGIIEKIQKAQMHKVMEVYKLSLPIEQQLNQHRAWNI